MGKSGKTLAEYALILFLVALVSIPALQILGNAIDGLLREGNAPSKAGQLFALLNSNGGATDAGSPVSGAGGGNGEGSETSEIEVGPDPVAMTTPAEAMERAALSGTTYVNGKGQPIITVETPTDATGMMSTSANGGAMVATNEIGLYSSFKLASTLDELAKQADNPAEAAYLDKLARYSYILGHAEGELDDVKGIALAGYNRASALQDVIDYSGQLNQALRNPPAGMDPQALALAQGLGGEVYNVSQQYTTALAGVIDANGKVTRSWGPTNAGYAGASFSGAGQNFNNRTDRTSLLDYGSYEGFKKKANALLDNGTISSEPVKVTFTDARIMDGAAAGKEMPKCKIRQK